LVSKAIQFHEAIHVDLNFFIQDVDSFSEADPEEASHAQFRDSELFHWGPILQGLGSHLLPDAPL